MGNASGFGGYQPGPGPTPVVAVQPGRLSLVEQVFHLSMLILTCGLWYPVYRSRLRHVRARWRY